jgi:type I restriction enzyme M protein
LSGGSLSGGSLSGGSLSGGSLSGGSLSEADMTRRRTDKSFMVPVQEIQDNKYDLSINRYKEVVYEEKTYESPAVIISQIETLDKERADLLNQLKAMLV